MPDSTLQPEVTQLATALVEYADELIINTPVDLEYAQDRRGELAAFISTTKEWFSDPKKKAHDAHKVLCDREKETLAPAQNAMTLIDGAMQAHVVREQRKRVEEARRLEAERQKAEAAALAAQKAEDEALHKDEMDRIIAETETEAADEVLQTAETMQAQKEISNLAPVVAPHAEVSIKPTISWELVDIDKVPRNLLRCEVDRNAVNRLVRAKGMDANIPGIRTKESASIRTRRPRL